MSSFETRERSVVRRGKWQLFYIENFLSLTVLVGWNLCYKRYNERRQVKKASPRPSRPLFEHFFTLVPSIKRSTVFSFGKLPPVLSLFFTSCTLRSVTILSARIEPKNRSSGANPRHSRLDRMFVALAIFDSDDVVGNTIRNPQ